MKVKISIIIPAYNVAKYVGKTIESALNQTFTDYEVIVVNDGSKDDTGTICDTYAADNGKLRVINQENRGVTAARMNGVAHAKGEWVTFLDGDDQLPPDALTFLYKNTNNDIDVVSGICAHINTDGEILFCESSLGSGSISVVEYQKQICTSPKAHHGFLYRRELFKDIVVVSREVVNNEDQLLNLILASRIKGANCVNQIVHHYLERENSISHKAFPEQYWYFFFTYIEDNYKSFGIPRWMIDRYRLYRLLSLVRNEKELSLDLKQPLFNPLRDLEFSKSLGLRGNICLVLLKRPSSLLVSLLRFHPRSVITI